MPRTSEPVLEVRNLQIGFRGDDGVASVIEDVSFTVGRGEIVGIVGESGCGKSVTSFSIMGLLPPGGEIGAGEILLSGDTDIAAISPRRLREIQGKEMSMIFQEPLTSLNPLLTVGKQISEVLIQHERLSRKEARERSVAALTSVGIARAERLYDAYPHELSGGMRQRVMIAIAISCRPTLLIADEPTTALDVTIQAQILQLMDRLRRERGTSILFITHDLGVIAEIADRVVVMYAGQVVEDADVFDLFRSPKHPYTRALMASTPRIDDTREVLTSIPGSVPAPSNMPTGCRFQPRCPFATARCSTPPPLTETPTGDRVRCWLYEAEEVAA
jgi:oligopeptide/dipeptide ABC transporter ATP-binding protein